MKKILFTFMSIFLIIILIISISIIENTKNLTNIQKENREYEEYLEKEIFGTQVITIVNKAINQNEKNEIKKDEKGFYIANNTNSLKIELKMLNESKQVTYQMETIQKVGISGFIENFNLINFKCTKIEYHNKTKKVSKIIFEQVEE